MSFQILRTHGDLQKATFRYPDGRKTSVYRYAKLFVREWGRFVMCASYDEHFVFENPDKGYGAIGYLCTCGSPAGVVGYKAYAKDASPSDNGELFVCLEHANHGKHQPVNWS